MSNQPIKILNNQHDIKKYSTNHKIDVNEKVDAVGKRRTNQKNCSLRLK